MGGMGGMGCGTYDAATVDEGGKGGMGSSGACGLRSMEVESDVDD